MTEDQLQASIVEYVRWQVPRVIVFSVPNGAYFGKDRKAAERQMAKLRWTGLLPGVSDLILLACVNGISRAYFVEVKLPGRHPTEDQEAFMSGVRSMGFSTAVVRSLDDMMHALKAWGLAP